MPYLGTDQARVAWLICFSCVLLTFLPSTTCLNTKYYNNCSISTTVYTPYYDTVLVGCGNLAIRMTSHPDEANSYPLGEWSFKVSDLSARCIFEEECRTRAVNKITLMEPLPGNRSDIFACTVEGLGTCILLDPIQNVSTPLHIDEEKGTLIHTFSEKGSISSVVLFPDTDDPADPVSYNAQNASSVRMVVTMNTGPKSKAPYLNVFTFLRINLATKTISFMYDINITSIFTVMSTYLSETVKAFVYNDVIYHVVLHENSNFFGRHYAIVQTKVTFNGVTSIQAHLRCEREFYKNVTSADLLRKGETTDVKSDILYLLHISNTTSVIASIHMDALETFFKEARQDCERNSYVQWIMPAARKTNPCIRMGRTGVASSILLTDSALISRVVSPSLGDKASDLTVYRQNDVVVAVVATPNIVYKIRLGARSEILATWQLDKQLEEHIHVEMGGDVVYVTSNHSVTTIRPSECSSNDDMGSCLRDVTSCVWCDGRPPGCVHKNDCSSPITIYKGDEPMVTEIYPAYFSSCGRSRVTVIGTNLDQARHIDIRLGTKECKIEHVTNTIVKCRPPPQTVDKQYNDITVTWNNDTDNIFKESVTTGLPCPAISGISPSYTVRSGGVRLTITGSNLDILPEDTTLYLMTNDVQNTSSITVGGECQIQGSPETMLICSTPPVRGSHLPMSVDWRLLPALSGEPDGIYETLSLTSQPSTRKLLQVLEDPMIEYVGKAITLNNLVLTLKGKYLRNVDKSMITISIFSNGFCNITEISDTELKCKSKPVNSSIHIDRHITVMFGDNLIFFPGVVTYEVNHATFVTSTGSQYHFTKPEMDSMSTVARPALSQEIDGHSASTVGVISASLVVFVLGMCFIAVWRMVKRRRERGGINRDRPSIVSYNGSRAVIRGEGTSFNMPESSLMDSVSDVLDDTTRDLLKRLEECGMIIRRDCIKMAELIGKGNFGSVYKGYLTVVDRTSVVAIKTLHNNESRGLDENQFLQEAFVMKDFRHENVMALEGICLDVDALPLVILPFMEHGDLLSYLHDDKHIPTVKDLVSFGLDIAEGMTYLANLKFVHRDLAARNCMLDANCRVKVADFGLSRDIYETSYYSTKHKGTKLPVKWMALESIRNGVFNEKTDVWSYGITLWELMTRGVRPYATVDNWDMERYLTSGRRLPQPIYCPVNLYKVMRRCWSPEPQERPCFADIRQCIRLMLDRVHHQLAGADQTNIASTYVNVDDRDRYVYENEENFT